MDPNILKRTVDEQKSFLEMPPGYAGHLKTVSWTIGLYATISRPPILQSDLVFGTYVSKSNHPTVQCTNLAALQFNAKFEGKRCTTIFAPCHVQCTSRSFMLCWMMQVIPNTPCWMMQETHLNSSTVCSSTITLPSLAWCLAHSTCCKKRKQY